jgi:hypothetical protein
MSLVELERFYTPVEADLARLRLANAGIESVIFDGESLYVGAVTGIRLMVAEEDESEAREVLEAT